MARARLRMWPSSAAITIIIRVTVLIPSIGLEVFPRHKLRQIPRAVLPRVKLPYFATVWVVHLIVQKLSMPVENKTPILGTPWFDPSLC